MDIQLHHLQTPDAKKSTISFPDNDVITVGREPSCDLVLDCKEKIISRQHAHIIKKGSSYTLTDTSANGTFINNQHPAIGHGNSVDLHNGDTLQLGHYSLTLTLNTATVSTIKNTPKQQKKTNHQAILGDINERFSPPAALIPQDWDLNINTPTTSAEASYKPPPLLQEAMRFPPSETLINSFVKGLGLSKNTLNHLDEEKMRVLGRCFRGAISGMIKQKNQVEKIKTTLCFSEKSMLDDLQKSSFDSFSTADDLFKKIIFGEKSSIVNYPLEVIRCQKEIIEDQTAIYQSFNASIDSFREALSPHAIEKHYHEKSSYLTGKIIPSIGKWDMYKKQWGEKCMSFKKTIKNHFQSQIKDLNKKRIEEKTLGVKNIHHEHQ
ncbi:MAG: FHA domain-containing protein [Cellvibrionaceae bacterium]|nr:FHA domain-containing protein [Cellvibrionaceae bacterium]